MKFGYQLEESWRALLTDLEPSYPYPHLVIVTYQRHRYSQSHTFTTLFTTHHRSSLTVTDLAAVTTINHSSAMDPSPGNFPLLSSFMSRVPSFSATAAFNSELYDIEQPRLPPPSDPSSSSSSGINDPELIAQMPRISDPKLLASITRAIYDIAQTRSMLRVLGDRPDHESVDNAKAKLADLDAHLSRQLEEIVLSPRPPHLESQQWRSHQAEKEKECRKLAEDEKRVYKAVIQLDEMHDAYEKLLKDAEKRLDAIYNSPDGAASADPEEEKSEIEEVKEEVVGLLQKAYGQGIERIDLSNRSLRLLPEAFWRISGLLALDVSTNQLTVCAFRFSHPPKGHL